MEERLNKKACSTIGLSARRNAQMGIKMKKRIAPLLLAAFCILSMNACGSTGGVEETTVIINKDGSITEEIIADFAKEYYSQEELKEFTQKAASTYNAKSGDDKSVLVSRVEAKSGTVRQTMEYKSADDYTGFNGKYLFAGTVAEAYDAGYDLDMTLQESGEDGNSIGKSEILQMGENHIVIAEEAVRIQVPSKVLYTGGRAELVDTKTVAAGSEDGYTYVIYK